MSLINISNLTFAYEGSYDNIFENVGFQIDTDWKLGFIGRNGRGKTTFLNLLLGKYPYEGSISSSVDFEYFPFEVKDGSQNTIDVVGGIGRDHLQWELLREVSLLELDEAALYRPFDTLSNGERTKVLLAALFLKENSFLLIDEPTNHLDMRGRKVVSDYLSGKKGFILVSHDRVFLDGCVDHILSINKTDIEIQRGNFSSWFVNKERRDGFELSENEKLKGEIQRLSAAAKRTSAWSDQLEKTKCGSKNSGSSVDRGYIGHKSAKMMSRSKGIERRRQAAAEEKSKLLRNLESIENLKIAQLPYHANRLVSLRDVSICYGGKAACRNICLAIDRGDRVALCGKNGSGKSSVLKLILGENMTYTGGFEKGSRLTISYVPQDTQHLRGSLSDYARQSGIDESLFKTILRKLDFSRVQFEKDMRDFSGGQKKKVLIARSLSERTHLLIWDEPLNYIDILSRMQIEQMLLECEPTMLFVEHDGAFCRNVATRTITL
ncbi:MAG: ABC-F type ribosomal protection protein [Bacillota bacterium]